MEKQVGKWIKWEKMGPQDDIVYMFIIIFNGPTDNHRPTSFADEKVKNVDLDTTYIVLLLHILDAGFHFSFTFYTHKSIFFVVGVVLNLFFVVSIRLLVAAAS